MKEYYETMLLLLVEVSIFLLFKHVDSDGSKSEFGKRRGRKNKGRGKKKYEEASSITKREKKEERKREKNE